MPRYETQRIKRKLAHAICHLGMTLRDARAELSVSDGEWTRWQKDPEFLSIIQDEAVNAGIMIEAKETGIRSKLLEEIGLSLSDKSQWSRCRKLMDFYTALKGKGKGGLSVGINILNRAGGDWGARLAPEAQAYLRDTRRRLPESTSADSELSAEHLGDPPASEPEKI